MYIKINNKKENTANMNMTFNDKNIMAIFETSFIPLIEKTVKIYNSESCSEKFSDLLRDLLLANISIIDAGKLYFKFINEMTSDKKVINELLKLFKDSVPLFKWAQKSAKSYSAVERRELLDFWDFCVKDLTFRKDVYESFMDDLASECDSDDKDNNGDNEEDNNRVTIEEIIKPKKTTASKEPIFTKSKLSDLDSFLNNQAEDYEDFDGEEEEDNDVKSADEEEEDTLEIQRFDSDDEDLVSLLKEKASDNIAGIFGMTWKIDENADQILPQLPSEKDILESLHNRWKDPDNVMRAAGIKPTGVMLVIAPDYWEPDEEFIKKTSKVITEKLEENEGKFFVITFLGTGECVEDLDSILRDPSTKCENPFYKENLMRE